MKTSHQVSKLIVPIALGCMLSFASSLRASPNNPPAPAKEQAEGDAARGDNLQRTAATNGKPSAPQGKDKDNAHAATEPPLQKLQESLDKIDGQLSSLNAALSKSSTSDTPVTSDTTSSDVDSSAKSLIPPDRSLFELFILGMSWVIGPLASWLLTRSSLRRVGLL